MKHNTTRPKTGCTIQEVAGLFKVYDKYGKYRQLFKTRAEAEVFATSLSARRAPMAMDAGADLSGWGTGEPARVQVLQPALFGAEVT